MISKETLYRLGYKNEAVGVNNFEEKVESLRNMNMQQRPESRLGVSIKASHVLFRNEAYETAKRRNTERRKQLFNLYEKRTTFVKRRSSSTSHLNERPPNRRSHTDETKAEMECDRAIRNRRSQSVKVKLKFLNPDQDKPINVEEMQQLAVERRQRKTALLTLKIDASSIAPLETPPCFGAPTIRTSTASRIRNFNLFAATTRNEEVGLTTVNKAKSDRVLAGKNKRPSTVQFNFSGLEGARSADNECAKEKVMHAREVYMQHLVGKRKWLTKVASRKRSSLLSAAGNEALLSRGESPLLGVPSEMEQLSWQQSLAPWDAQEPTWGAKDDMDSSRALQHQPTDHCPAECDLGEPPTTGTSDMPPNQIQIQEEKRSSSPSQEFRSLFQQGMIGEMRDEEEQNEGLRVKLRNTANVSDFEGRMSWPFRSSVGRPEKTQMNEKKVDILAAYHDDYNGRGFHPQKSRRPPSKLVAEPWSPPSTAETHTGRPFSPFWQELSGPKEMIDVRALSGTDVIQ